MSMLSNIGAVARREFTVRVRTRSFILGTALLVVGTVAIALLPVIIRYADRSGTERVAVHVGPTDLTSDPVATMTAVLNPPPATGSTKPDEPPDFTVTRVDDVDAARRAVTAGEYAALLTIERAADGELVFAVYTEAAPRGRTGQLCQVAADQIAREDRLSRLGLDQADLAALEARADLEIKWSDPARTDPIQDTAAMIGKDMLSFGLTVLIFMIIIMYGTWVAMSVVEEKSSRVMEVVLNAATPFQLLTGKVLGVGAVALAQYGAIVVTGVVALLAQGSVASVILGESGGAIDLPEGLTVELLLLFGVYGVLGFLMYASLYAAAGSLVSRQEDVNAVIMPMTLVSTGGYLIGVYAATGILDPDAGWIVALSQVPFVSPFMMLGRIATDVAAPWEIVLSVGLLLVFIVGALWLASRIYAAGVLLYGQRPGLRAIVRLARAGM